MEQKWTDKFKELDKMMRTGDKNIEDRASKKGSQQLEDYHSVLEKKVEEHLLK